MGSLIFALVGCERAERPAPAGERQTAQVTVFNATHDVLPIDVRSIESAYSVDCELVGENPSRYLSPEHLTAPRELGADIDADPLSGMELPLNGDREITRFTDRCRFAFVEPKTSDQRLPPVAVVWPRSLADKVFYPDVDAPSELLPQGQTLVAMADYSAADPDQVRPWRHRPCGGDFDSCTDEERADLLEAPEGADYEWMVLGDEPKRASWESIPLSYRPVGNPEDQACDAGADATPLMWDEPPSGRWRVEGVDPVSVEFGSTGDNESSGGEANALVEWDCWDVQLSTEEDQRAWSICGSERFARRIESDHVAGGVFVEFFTEQQSSTPPAAYRALTVELERTDGDGAVFETERIEAVRGHGIPDHIGLNWRTQAATECESFREIAACDQMSLPMRLQIDAGGEVVEIRPGETMGLEPTGDRRLELVRGLHRTVSDLRCGDERVGPEGLSYPGAYMELVYYPGASEVEL